jgi:hypothetical protein
MVRRNREMGAKVAPIISSKEISGEAERQRQTHKGLNSYKETAGDIHEQVSKNKRIAYIRRMHSSHMSR